MTLPTNDFLPFATGISADVQSQADFAAASSTTNGFTAGIAEPANVNKVWRQSSFMAAAIAACLVQKGISAPDNGDLNGMVAKILSVLGGYFKSASDYGAVADFGITSASANDVFIQSALNTFPVGGGTLIIIKGIAWNYSAITHPDEVTILDYSGYDWSNGQWTGQVKTIMKTASPGSKNANEFKLISQYHPALTLDNVGDGVTEKTTSVVHRWDGVTDWQIAAEHSTAGTGRRYGYAYYGTYAGFDASGGTHVFEIDPQEGNFGFNSSAVPGIDRYYQSYRAATSIERRHNATNQGWDLQFSNATEGLLLRQQISGVDGSSNWWNMQTNVTFGYRSRLGESWGNLFLALPKTGNYAVQTTDSEVVFTNTGASGGFIFTLESAVPGLKHEFYVTSANNLQLQPQSGDNFRGYTAATGLATKAAGKYMSSSTAGSLCRIKCVVAGTWEFERLGTWADQP